jgi:hypothetical protein
MKKYTIISSETVTYLTTVEAESENQALDIFCNLRITDQSKLVPEHYEGFQIDSVEENG